MSTNAPSPPLLVTATVTMQAPSFVPGSVVSANITLQAKHHHPLAPSQSATVPNRPRPQLAQSASAASSTLASFPHHSATARADYVVAELSGRWTSDRSWLIPHAHPRANPSIHLDSHAQAPLAPPTGPRPTHPPARNPTLGPYPWSAALADANAIGGGGRTGHSGIIFRSQPLIVCEREQIPAGSQVSFAVNAVLPDTLPPTLRGSAMRYAYALVIVVKFSDASVPHVVRVPFRVLPTVRSFVDLGNAVHNIIAVPTPRDVGPRPNRFLQHDDGTALRMSARLLKPTPPDDIDIALALSMNGRLTSYKPDTEQNIPLHYADTSVLSSFNTGIVAPLPDTSSIFDDHEPPVAPNGLRVYSVTRGTDPVARVYLSKRVHHLGDCVTVMFHFHGAQPCYRIGARLEAQEVVNARFSVGHEQSAAATSDAVMSVAAAAADAPFENLFTGTHPAGDDDNIIGGEIDDGVVFRKMYGEHGEYVTAARNTEVTFSIPHDAPASFTTGVVTIRWLVHFVFVIAQARVTSDNGLTENGGDGVRLDSMDNQLESTDELELLGSMSITDGNGSDKWEGGNWTDVDSNKMKHIPDKNVDVLRWTLPIIVSGQPGSQWGTRNLNRISHVSMG